MSLADEVRELQRQVSQLTRATSGLPVRLASGGTGGAAIETDLVFWVLTENMAPATGTHPEHWGEGAGRRYDDDGVEVQENEGSTPTTLYQRFFRTMNSGYGGWFQQRSRLGENVWVLITPDCAPAIID